MVLSVKKEKPLPAHHRKRHGHHHRRTKQYEKHYWPYLPLLAIVGFGFMLNILWTPISHSIINHDVLGYATNTSVIGLLDETNTQRNRHGVAHLQLNSQLAQAAQAKAEDMASRNYWSHTTPDGNDPWWFVDTANYPYLAVGENLAYGFASSSTTVAGWMNSPSHKSNLLNIDFHDVGFGIARSADYVSHGPQTIIVALYGKTSASSPAVNAHQTPAVVPNTTLPQRAATSTTAESHRVTRLQTVASSLPTEGVGVLIVIAAGAAALFIFRHTRALHRKLVKGERFILRHATLDVTFILIVVLGILLTRTAGFIN